MKNNLKQQRIAILVDIPNLYYAARKVAGGKVHFGKLINELRQNRVLTRAMAFLAKSSENQQFVHKLKEYGYTLYYATKKDGDSDVQLAIQAIAVTSKCDTEILVTGDGDFIPVVTYLRSHGLRTEIASYDEWVNEELKNKADRYIKLNGREIIL